MCGRNAPGVTMEYGDIHFPLLKEVARQIPAGIVVQFHRDGEPLLYHNLSAAISLFKNSITNIVTNGKLLLDRKNDLIGKLTTLSISIFERDHESEEQYNIITEFLRIKGDQKPYVTLRIVGEVDLARYKKLGVPFVFRTLRSPLGNADYQRAPCIPEIGVCWDFLQKPCISWNGEFSICCGFDPEKKGVLGNINHSPIASLWGGTTRSLWMERHLTGHREQVPLCATCDYWGIPVSP